MGKSLEVCLCNCRENCIIPLYTFVDCSLQFRFMPVIHKTRPISDQTIVIICQSIGGISLLLNLFSLYLIRKTWRIYSNNIFIVSLLLQVNIPFNKFSKFIFRYFIHFRTSISPFYSSPSCISKWVVGIA